MVGRIISNRYRILEELERGGMGIVYKAEDLKLKRKVVLKFLSPELTRDVEAKQRFIHEAQTASSIDHPNICTIHDFLETGEGQVFIVMEYYHGKTLKDLVKEKITLHEVVDIAIQIAKGLSSAHQKGIIHRDVKPANIMITEDGVVKILDFGIAKLRGKSGLTRTGITMGTVAYMSPEQAQGKDVDHRTDIWSFGVVLYEMLTGELPFKGEYEQAVIYSILNEEPEPISSLQKHIPSSLENIVNKCLQKDPLLRYRNMEEVLRDLHRAEDSLKTGSKSYTEEKTNKANKRIIYTFTGIFFVALFLFGYLVLYKGKSSPSSQAASSRTKALWSNSIAVLPFRDFSPNKDQEYFCYGMTDAINERLSRIKGLKVISTTSVMRYRDTNKDIKEIGNELGVVNILEGSIMKEGDRIRVRAQLIDARTGFHLWSDTFDRKLESIFDVQDEISMAITEALKAHISPEDLGQIRKRHSRNTVAYDYYLKGRYFIDRRYLIFQREQDYETAIKMFNKAIELDPEYALAYVGIGWAETARYLVTGNIEFNMVLRNFKKAYALNPDLSETNAGMGFVFSNENKFDKAYERFKRAFEINPDSSEVYFATGLFLRNAGLYKQAIYSFDRAIELDPFQIWFSGGLARVYFYNGNLEKAREYIKKTLEIAPESTMYLELYFLILIAEKDYVNAEKTLRKIERVDGKNSKFYRAILLAAKGDREKALNLSRNIYVYSLLGIKKEALELIEKNIGQDEEVEYLSLLNNPYFKFLHGEPEFQKILHKQKKLYEERVRRYRDIFPEKGSLNEMEI